MFEYILLLAGLLGFGAAGLLDLKTTEFPDWLPYSMIIFGLGVHGLWALATGSAHIFINSLVTGAVLLAFGLALYFTKQWGDGDAWLLGAMGFLFPTSLGFSSGQTPFQIVLLFNFFFIAFAYLVGYSIIIGARNSVVRKKFMAGLSRDRKGLAGMIAAFTGACLGLAGLMTYTYGVPLDMLTNILLMPFLLAFILLFIRYCRLIESDVFKKKVSASKLRIGDVLVDKKWKGLTEKELKTLRGRGGTYVVKEGVRFAPVFIMTMIISLFFGNIMPFFLFR
jgi:hypothetical protein